MTSLASEQSETQHRHTVPSFSAQRNLPSTALSLNDLERSKLPPTWHVPA